MSQVGHVQPHLEQPAAASEGQELHASWLKSQIARTTTLTTTTHVSGAWKRGHGCAQEVSPLATHILHFCCGGVNLSTGVTARSIEAVPVLCVPRSSRLPLSNARPSLSNRTERYSVCKHKRWLYDARVIVALCWLPAIVICKFLMQLQLPWSVIHHHQALS